MKFTAKNRLLIAILLFTNLIVVPTKADEAKARVYLFAAEEALVEKDYSGALSAVRSAERELGSSNALLKSLLVKILFEQGKYTQAKHEFDAFMEFNPNAKLTREMAPYLIKVDRKIKAESEWQTSFDNEGLITGHFYGKDKSFAVTVSSVEIDSQDNVSFKTSVVAVDQFGKQKLRKDFEQENLNIRGIAGSDSGRYIIGGRVVWDASTNWEAWVAILDSSGNVIAPRSFKIQGKSTSINDIVQVDGGYLLIGTVNVPSENSDNKVWVEKVGPLGETLATTIIESNGSHFIHSAIIDGDGGVMLAGQRSNKGWLAKMDNNGKLVWQIDHSPQDFASFESISKTEAGRYIAVGWVGDDSSKKNGSAYLAIFNADGKLFKDKVLAGTYVDTALKLEGGLVPVVVTSLNQDKNVSKVNLAFVDAQGDIARTIELDNAPYAIVRTEDGGFIILHHKYGYQKGKIITRPALKKRFLD